MTVLDSVCRDSTRIHHKHVGAGRSHRLPLALLRLQAEGVLKLEAEVGGVQRPCLPARPRVPKVTQNV